MGRRVKLCAIAALVVTAVMYLAGSFAAADFNIANWDTLGRMLGGIMWPLITAFYCGIIWEQSE